MKLPLKDGERSRKMYRHISACYLCSGLQVAVKVTLSWQYVIPCPMCKMNGYIEVEREDGKDQFQYPPRVWSEDSRLSQAN